MLALERINPLAGLAPSTSLKREHVRIEPVPPQVLQRPLYRLLALAVERDFACRNLKLTAPTRHAIAVDVHNSINIGINVAQVFFAVDATHYARAALRHTRSHFAGLLRKTKANRKGENAIIDD